MNVYYHSKCTHDLSYAFIHGYRLLLKVVGTKFWQKQRIKEQQIVKKNIAKIFQKQLLFLIFQWGASLRQLPPDRIPCFHLLIGNKTKILLFIYEIVGLEKGIKCLNPVISSFRFRRELPTGIINLSPYKEKLSYG